MDTFKFNQLWDRMFTFTIRMSAASLAIVGLLFVVAYEFHRANEFTEAFKWMNFAHIGILATIFFSISSIFGIIQKVPLLTEKWMKWAGWAMALLMISGLVVLFYLLVILFENTT